MTTHNTPEEHSSAYPRTGEIEAAYGDEAKTVFIRYSVMGVSRFFRAYLIRVDSLTNDASYTTDGIWHTIVKSGDWTVDASGLGEIDDTEEDEDTTPRTWEEMYDYLVEVCGVSEETLRVVTSINGTSTDTMESILFVVTGYRSFDQITGD